MPSMVVCANVGEGRARESEEYGTADGSVMLVAQRASARAAAHNEEVDGMPTFGIVPIGEARARTITGKRAELLQEYVGFIQGVPAGQAGVLKPGEGETTQAVRRRLNAAAEALGVNLEIRRTAGAVYFWASEGSRRGRPRKNPAA